MKNQTTVEQMSDREIVEFTDEALPVSLLGMSFLSHVRWSHERGNLILEQ
jgi:predicted aspartyl protease